MKIILIPNIFFVVFLWSSYGSACPCGGGAANPQFLNPGETWKFYLGLTHDRDFKTVDADGKLKDDGGPKQKNIFTQAVARAITNYISTSLTVPIQENVRGSKTKTAFSDPSIALRWIVFEENFKNPYVPRTQLIASYKHAIAQSVYESEVPYLMDVFGTGFSEIVPGVDLWWGQLDYKFGITHVFIWPFERTFDETKVEPGKGCKTTLTTGYQIIDMVLRAFVHFDHEQRLASKVNGQKTDRTIVNSISTSADWTIKQHHVVNFMFKRTAALFYNKNTMRGNSINFSYSYSL